MSESPASSSSLRVLLVEDDEDHASLIRKHLRASKTSPHVTWAATLAAAKEQFRSSTFDVVLLDLNLPDGTVETSMSSVIAWSGGAPVVVLTALDDTELGIHAINEGAQDYLVKQEMTAPNLDRSLRYAIERAKSRRCLNELTVQLQRANMALESFSSIVVHDLKSPAGRLKWYVELLLRDKQSVLSDTAKDYLQILATQAERMDGLVNDLWTYAQPGGDQEESTQVDCQALIESIFEMLDRPDAFLIEASDLPVIVTQRTPLEVVLRNLIQNSIKHRKDDGGRIRIAAKRENDFVEFCVHDDGPGLSDAVLRWLAEPHDGGRAMDVASVGLGLVVIRRIVERRGGLLKAKNAEGGGAEFCVVWPLTEPTLTHIESIESCEPK